MKKKSAVKVRTPTHSQSPGAEAFEHDHPEQPIPEVQAPVQAGTSVEPEIPEIEEPEIEEPEIDESGARTRLPSVPAGTTSSPSAAQQEPSQQAPGAEPGLSVREIRGKLGLNRVAFAAELGVSAGAVQYWEENRGHPSARHTPKLQELATRVGGKFLAAPRPAANGEAPAREPRRSGRHVPEDRVALARGLLRVFQETGQPVFVEAATELLGPGR